MSTLNTIIKRCIELIKTTKITPCRNQSFVDLSSGTHSRISEWLEDKETKCKCCAITALLLSAVTKTNNEDFPYGEIAYGTHVRILTQPSRILDIPANRVARIELFFEGSNGYHRTGDFGIVKTESCNALAFRSMYPWSLERLCYIFQHLRNNQTFDSTKIMDDVTLDKDLAELLTLFPRPSIEPAFLIYS